MAELPWLVLRSANLPDRIEVASAVGLKRYQRRSGNDPVESGYVPCHYVRKVLMAAHPHDRDNVCLAGDGVDLAHPIGFGELNSEVCEAGRGRIYEHEGVDHRT